MSENQEKYKTQRIGILDLRYHGICKDLKVLYHWLIDGQFYRESKWQMWEVKLGAIVEAKCKSWNLVMIETISGSKICQMVETRCDGRNQFCRCKPSVTIETRLRSSQGWIRGWIQVIWLIPCVLVGSWCDGWNQVMVETIGYHLKVAYVHNTWFFNLNQLW